MEENKTTNEAAPEEATTVGMYLKYTRLKQKKSLESVSEVLCIRKIYIKAIEEDNIQDLPPVPYGIGFVRSYASYLGLNAERIVQFYKQQTMPQKEKGMTKVVRTHTPITMPSKLHIYIGLAAILFIYFLWLLFGGFFKKSDPDTSLDTTVQASDFSVEKVSDEEFDNTQAPADQVNIVEDFYEEPVVVAQPKLLLKVKGDSWIELKDDQKVYLSGIQHKGFTFETELAENMELSIGRYYNVETYIDGVLTTIATPKRQTKLKLDSFLKH